MAKSWQLINSQDGFKAINCNLKQGHNNLSLSSFSIHYTNIGGLNSNFSSVETHLATFFPNLFLLSKTQLSSQSSPDPFQISCYILYSRFHSKGSVCAYCNINTPITRFMDLESLCFDVLWLRRTLYNYYHSLLLLLLP